MNNAQKKILVVDDDTTFLLMLKSFLEKKGYIAHTVSNAEKGLQAILSESFDLILSDYRMPGMDGMELLKTLDSKNINIPIILVTSYGDIKLAVKAIKLGAADYLTKPVNPDELIALVESVLKKPVKNPPPITADQVRVHRGDNDEYILGVSDNTQKVNEHAELVGPTNMSVLLQGESGTGKEYVAQQIHNFSKRSKKAFVAIDCGSLSKELANSELFGHVKGSFTGAATDHTGQFELANGGTLFLDEIGNLGYDIQIKLLRAIQEKVIRPVGGKVDIPIDVRLISATNENLVDAISSGKFREDLYHRINEFKIEISPLRLRPEEIEQFAHFFLAKANSELEKDISGFTSDTLNFLKNYDWPGNLRELKNVVKRSVLLTKDSLITKTALPSEILNKQDSNALKSLQDSTDLKQLESILEKQKIMEAMEQAKYNKSKAAKLLNIDRKTLYNKIKIYGLEV